MLSEQVKESIDAPLEQILSLCLVYQFPVPMEALEPLCEDIPQYKQHLQRAIDLGLIKVSIRKLNNSKIKEIYLYQVDQKLPSIIPSIHLPNEPNKLFSLYGKVWSISRKLPEYLYSYLSLDHTGLTNEQLEEMFRLKLAQKDNPERFRDAFWTMWTNYICPNDDCFFLDEMLKVVEEIPTTGLCEKLAEYLQKGLWKEADYETTFILYQITIKAYSGADKKNTHIDVTDYYEKFPCEILREIDDLWVKYSNGKFGFSVQRDIWLSEFADGNGWGRYGEFAIKLGWHNREGLYEYNYKWYRECNLQYDDDAPIGHLPITWIEGCKSFLPCGSGYDTCRYVDDFLKLIEQLEMCNV